MDSIHQIVVQEMNEQRFNRKHIDAKIRKEIETNTETMAKMEHGIQLIEDYRSKYYTYVVKKTGEVKGFDSKNARVAQLQSLDLRELVMDIFVGVAYSQREELFSSVAAKMAARLKFSDKKEAVTTTAEMLAVLCATDAFDINKADRFASLMLVSRIPLCDAVVEFINNSQYLPPMVCEPLELTHNYSSGYLTHNDSLVLGSGNHHDGDLCLDVLNTMNRVALRLDTEFLSRIEEEPTYELDTQDKVDNWERFKEQSYMMYTLMAQQGNRFHLTHKVDKRGRIYACGYHINTQGAPFKKAMIELARQELVEGVPTN